jgi:hypothetical protein
VFIDTPPNMSAAVTDAIHAATLVVIPARLTVFDIAAVKETMDLCRKLGKPYAVVINGVPARRDNTESPYVREARSAHPQLNVPVWSGHQLLAGAGGRRGRQGIRFQLRGGERSGRAVGGDREVGEGDQLGCGTDN